MYLNRCVLLFPLVPIHLIVLLLCSIVPSYSISVPRHCAIPHTFRHFLPLTFCSDTAMKLVTGTDDTTTLIISGVEATPKASYHTKRYLFISNFFIDLSLIIDSSC